MRTSPYPYGYRITQNYKPGHTGYDLVGKKENGGDWIGCPVYACEEGKVWSVHNYPSSNATNNVGGNFVIVQSDNRFWYYGHFKENKVKVGQMVDTNTVVGLQGATGPVTGEHLHFELRSGTTFAKGTPTDPFVYMNEHQTTPPPTTDPCAGITQQFEETLDLLARTQEQVGQLEAQLAAEQQTSLRLTGENVTLVNKMNAAFAELETTKTQFDNFVRDSRVENGALRDENNAQSTTIRQLNDEIIALKKQNEEDKAHAAAQMAVAEGQIKEKDEHIRTVEGDLNDANIKLKSQADLIARLQTETLQAVDNKALFSEFMRRIWKIRRG